MNEAIPFQRSAIQPFACIGEAWDRVRGDYGLFLGITVVGLLIGGAVPLGILMGPMLCGMAKCYLDKGRGLPIRFDLLFKGFDHFVEALIASLILLGLSLVVVTPFIILIFIGGLLSAFGALSSHTAGLSLAGGLALGCGAFVFMLLISVLLGSFFAFTFPLIADRKLSGLDAVKLGAKAGLANFGGMLGLSLLLFLLSCAGLCCCYIGAFLVAPITIGTHMIAYEKVFGRAEV